MAAKGSGALRENAVRPLCDGTRSSNEIAAILGESQKYVQHVMKKYDLPRFAQGARTGKHNPAFVSGRKIDRDGYVLVRAPLGHPHARVRAGRNFGLIYEHRLIVEDSIGRILLPLEVVDHVDGLRLHNAPSNLRIFDKNADHLAATISGKRPSWSGSGIAKMSIPSNVRANFPKVHTYDRMKKSGDARLLQILLALIQLGEESPYLLGTPIHLVKAGIVDYSRSSLERAVDDLRRKYA